MLFRNHERPATSLMSRHRHIRFSLPDASQRLRVLEEHYYSNFGRPPSQGPPPRPRAEIEHGDCAKENATKSDRRTRSSQQISMAISFRRAKLAGQGPLS